jgi:hypothetical protein
MIWPPNNECTDVCRDPHIMTVTFGADGLGIGPHEADRQRLAYLECELAKHAVMKAEAEMLRLRLDIDAFLRAWDEEKHQP